MVRIKSSTVYSKLKTDRIQGRLGPYAMLRNNRVRMTYYRIYEILRRSLKKKLTKMLVLTRKIFF